MKLDVRALTPGRWADLEALFGARGCGIPRRCWCMYYRRSGGDPMARPQANRAALKKLAEQGQPPGLIGYRGREPVGWVSLGPRRDFAKLERSRVMKPVDATPVWSIVCFVVPPEQRGRGVARALLAGAIAYARRRGARLLEAYPVDRPGRSRDDAMWFGAKPMYDRAGFVEVARRKRDRPVMRRRLK
jgi:GNAT superfamily N-acetyltransferase